MYNFLNPSKGQGRVAAYVFGILAAVIVIFGVVWSLIWLRDKVARRFNIDYDRTQRRRGRELGALEEQDMIELREDVK